MKKLFTLTALLLCLGATAQAADARVYIDISNPAVRRMPIAVPQFTPASGGAQSPGAAKGTDILIKNLNFTGLFEVLNQAGYLGGAGDEFNPRQWSRIGAELLASCNYRVQGDRLTMECRLFDVLDGKQLVGRQYDGTMADLPAMMNRFADEIMLAITGERSVFSTLIAFTHAEGGNKNVWLMDFDGGNPRAFTQKQSLTLYPAWSADGSLLTYSSFVNRHPAVFVHATSGGNGRMIINQSGVNITPTFRNNGQVAASLSFAGPTNIYLTDAGGQIIKNLTNGLNIDVNPTFSPDGKYMAFVSDRGGAPQVYILNMDSGEIRRLTYGHKYCAAPNWSPKGDRIVFQANTGGGFQIATIKPDGSDLQVLTTGGGEDPSFSPDGRLIAYASRRSGTYQIYVITASGQEIGRITNLSGDNSDPSWSPRGLAGN